MGWSDSSRGQEETANLVTTVRRCIEHKGKNITCLPNESLAVKNDGT